MEKRVKSVDEREPLESTDEKLEPQSVEDNGMSVLSNEVEQLGLDENVANEVGHQREMKMGVIRNTVHCTRDTVHDMVHCTVMTPRAIEEEGQVQNQAEALTIPGISRKSPDPGSRPEGATHHPEAKINPNRGEELGSRLSVTNTCVKMRKSKKHRNNPDKFKQVTLKMISKEVIKSPGTVEANHSFDQSKVEQKS